MISESGVEKNKEVTFSIYKEGILTELHVLSILGDIQLPEREISGLVVSSSVPFVYSQKFEKEDEMFSDLDILVVKKDQIPRRDIKFMYYSQFVKCSKSFKSLEEKKAVRRSLG